MVRGSPPPNAPRGPAAFRGRGRGFGRSYYLTRGSGRGRGKGATGLFSPAQSSALDQGAVFIDSRTDFSIIGETGLRRNSQTLSSSSAASIVGVAPKVSNPGFRTSTTAVGIPQGPAWNPPKGPRAYMMRQNQPRIQRTRTSSSSSSTYRAATDRSPSPRESRVVGRDEKQNLKTYSAVVAGLNKGLKAKVEASDSSGLIQCESMRGVAGEAGNKVAGSSSGESSKKSFVLGEEVETANQQVSVPLAYRDSNNTASHRPRTANIPANELVKFSSSVDRPGWVRTTDEFMVLEFGSAGPITLWRNGLSWNRAGGIFEGVHLGSRDIYRFRKLVVEADG